MARLPEHLRASEHVSRSGDLLVLTIHVDTSAYVATLRNLGPAWSRLERWATRFRIAAPNRPLRYHATEDRAAAAMHTTYDRRRRARRRRTRR